MLRREPIFIATEDALVSSGIQPDRHDLKKALWEAAQNVVFQGGKIRRKKPAALAFSIGENQPIRGISQQRMNAGPRWLWVGANGKVWRWAFGSPELIKSGLWYNANQSFGGLRPTFYDFTHYGDWTIINDTLIPYIHKPEIVAPQTVPYSEAPQSAMRYMKVLNFMMAIGYGPRGTRVGWSDADDIFTWTAAADNLAGSISIDEFDTPIRAACKLADSIALFAEDQMALVRYVGGTFVFSQKVTLDGIGAVGKAAVATDTRYVVGVHRAGIWWTDGASFRYIDEGYLADHLQNNVNWAQAAKIVAVRNDYTGCFEFHFPMGASSAITEAWSWDPKTGGWSPTPPATSKDERRMFEAVISGNAEGQVLLDDNDYALAGPLILNSRPIAFGDTHLVHRIDEIDLLLHEAQNVEFRVGSCELPSKVEDDWEFTAWLETQAQRTTYPIERLPEAPFFKLQFRNKPVSNDWRFDLQGFLLYGEATGTAQRTK